MHFIIFAQDKPDCLTVRMNNRPAHLDYIRSQDGVVLAGPLLTDDADPKLRGSMLIIEVEDRAAAEKFAEHDPYALVGLFAKVEILPWIAALGSWLPSQNK